MVLDHFCIQKNARLFDFKESFDGAIMEGGSRSTGFAIDSYKIWSSNLPVFSTLDEGSKWSEQQRANADKYVKENIWVHPDLQDTYKNNGKLEYPQQAPRPCRFLLVSS